MIAKSSAVSLINPFSFPNTLTNMPQGYFRSRLFVTASVNNPLIAAASPLLSLLERLCISPTLPEVNSIRDNIEHELLAFRSRLTSQNYAEEFILIAYYLLSATVDELLGKNYLRLFKRPAEFKAFTPSSHDELGPQHRFFNIVTYIKERAQQYLDLLELSYYCLITGFEGEYHLRPDGRQALDNLIEELHQLIQQHRVNKPQRLFRNRPQIPPVKTKQSPLLAALGLAICAIIALYLGSHTLLEHKAKTLLLSSRALENMEN